MQATTATPGNVALVLTNECPDGVLVDEAAVLDDGEWLLDNTMILPADPAPGEQLPFEVIFSPIAPGPQTNVVAFRVGEAAGAHWRIFTVRGQATE